ncbi:MAG: 6-carboxytetrahydropterin synthase [Desulfurococcales archaeon]|nr:6-carboxytetrahydropterin synthase [Desulfurococcales archaeon]
MPRYCVSTIVSIALRARRFDGRLHGHDVTVKICIETPTRLDIVKLKQLLQETASKYDHTFIDETLGGEPLIEDLAAKILVEFIEYLSKLELTITDAWIKAIIPDGEIILSKEDLGKWRA